jgi:TolA-binding protein
MNMVKQHATHNLHGAKIMARPKRSSTVLTNAEQREAGIRSISDVLDLGNGLNLSSYSQRIASLRQKISTYNTTIASVDDLARDIKDLEKEVRQASEQMLLGIGAVYGKDSREYGKAGGVRKSERKRSSKRNKTEPKPTATDSESTNETELELNEVVVPSTNGNSNGTTNGSTNGSTNGKVNV